MSPAVEFLGLNLQSPTPRRCGVCGYFGALSKAHVPPQAAGNTGATTRVRQRIIDGAITDGRAAIGGIWVRGLCVKCNSLAGDLTDRQYADFARAVAARASSSVFRPGDATVPAVSVAPGPVARSVLYSMHALNPKLRELFPELAASLARGDDEARLPDGLRLYVAQYLRPRARVAGPVHAFRVLTQSEAYMTFAEIYFAPLAWVLAPDEPGLYFQDHGWVDVSEWSLYSGGRSAVDLRWLTNSLPRTGHPLHDSDDWVHLFSSDITPIVEGVASLE